MVTQEEQHALQWATDKCLKLDADNQRLMIQVSQLKTLIGQIRTLAITARTDPTVRESLCDTLMTLFTKKRDE